MNPARIKAAAFLGMPPPSTQPVFSPFPRSPVPPFPRSLFPVPCSRFPVPCSPFPVPRSTALSSV